MRRLLTTIALIGAATRVEAVPYVNVKALLPTIRISHEIEKKYGIPENLLTAIARVESNTKHFAVNARGRGHFFKTKEEAAAFVQKLQSQGVKDFNVGYMQINYSAHRKKFKSVGDMLDLRRNIEYAAKLLKVHYRQTGSWEQAVCLYKSGASESTRKYKNLVFSIWAKVHVPKHFLKSKDEAKSDKAHNVVIKKSVKPYALSLAFASPKARADKFMKMVSAKHSSTSSSDMSKASFFKIS